MNKNPIHPSWATMMPLLAGGAVLGFLPYILKLFKSEKTMTKFEKTAVAFIGALCEKCDELQKEADGLRKELSKAPTQAQLDTANTTAQGWMDRATKAEQLVGELENALRRTTASTSKRRKKE